LAPSKWPARGMKTSVENGDEASLAASKWLTVADAGTAI
jgi:hypothetical protein